MKTKAKSGKVSNIALITLFFLVIVLAVGVYVVYLYWQQNQNLARLNQNANQSPLNINRPVETPTSLVEIAAVKRLIKPEDIKPEEAIVKAQIPSYPLPLNLQDVKNYSSIVDKLKPTKAAENLLTKNGFAVMSGQNDYTKNSDNFADFYSYLKNNDLPIFITADSLLHDYHIFFDSTLMKLEKDIFYDDIWQMSKELYDDSVNTYNNSDGELKEAAKQNVAYLAVALELLKPKADQIKGVEDVNSNDLQPYMAPNPEGIAFVYFSPEQAKKYEFNKPDFVKDEVEKELSLIAGHQGFDFSPIFDYKEDYSQYVPRGHYTRSEILKNYFMAMMWYGRMTALITGSPILQDKESLCTGPMNGIVSEAAAKTQTLQAGLIAKKFLETKDVQDRWQRIYAITGYFVGVSDDLGPYEYAAALKQALGNEITPQKLLEKYDDFKAKLNDLAYNPKIYGGLGACELSMPCPPLSNEVLQTLKDQAKKLLDETKGFRLMGQRFTLDSYLFSEIVSPYSGQYTGSNLALPTNEKPFTFTWDDQYAQFRNVRPFTWVKTDVKGCPEGREVRGFPRGLDIMALFGSERAKEILQTEGDANYSDFNYKFEALSKDIKAMPEDAWYQNLYLNWLYVLQSLLTKPGAGEQTFMQTQSWQDKSLNTALASWTELRHDTILYVKQSYTMAELGGGMAPPVVGYVEPAVQFYNRLLTLTDLTNLGLQKLVPASELDNLKITYSLNEFSDIIKKLEAISEKELANKALTDEEYYFIDNFGTTSQNLIDQIIGSGEVDPDIYKTTLVADVHTEGNVLKVLEEGVGYLKTLLAAYKLPDGRILVGAGPVFSYYEFKQPMESRLTDEKWREMLKNNQSPAAPDWTKSFSQ